MSTMIFVNLPVTDLARSRAFYEALGYSINENFSDENAASVVISDTIYVMLLTTEYFASFLSIPAADPRAGVGAQYALTVDSREEVDAVVERAIAAGGTAFEARDLGFMYSRAFQDPDGHYWEPVWMDPAAVEDASAE